MGELTQRERIGPGDMLELVRMLDDGKSEEQCRALTLLCPCRNRVYAPDVWERIFRARHSAAYQVKDRANHAIGTLLERAQIDPRSWDLLHRLEEQLGDDALQSVDAIGLWGPRHRPSRRKHMTACRTGRGKARAFLERQRKRSGSTKR